MVFFNGGKELVERTPVMAMDVLETRIKDMKRVGKINNDMKLI